MSFLGGTQFTLQNSQALLLLLHSCTLFPSLWELFAILQALHILPHPCQCLCWAFSQECPSPPHLLHQSNSQLSLKHQGTFSLFCEAFPPSCHLSESVTRFSVLSQTPLYFLSVTFSKADCDKLLACLSFPLDCKLCEDRGHTFVYLCIPMPAIQWIFNFIMGLTQCLTQCSVAFHGSNWTRQPGQAKLCYFF